MKDKSKAGTQQYQNLITCSADLDLLKLIEWGKVVNLSLKGQKVQVLVKFEICLAGCE